MSPGPARMDTVSEKSAPTLSEKVDSTKDRNSCVKFLIDNWFMLSTVAGVCLGFGIAFTVRATQPGDVAILWICKFNICVITFYVCITITSYGIPKSHAGVMIFDVC